MRSVKFHLFGVVAILFLSGLFSACASHQLGRLNDIELPSELTADAKKKFEVQDTPVTTPSAPESKVSEGLKAKAKKKKVPAPKAAKKEAKKNPYESRRPDSDPLWIGEKASYEITYFGMVAGLLDITILPYKVINDRKVYHIRGDARSSKVFSLFYKLEDFVETFVDYEGLFSHRFHLVLNESKQTRDALELYDYDKLQTFYWNRWNHRDKGYIETKNFYDIPAQAQDSVSALYYVRMIPLPTGSVITFPVVSEGKTWECVVNVIRREKIDTIFGKINAIVIKPETKYQGILQKKGDSFIWISDDEHRYVLRVEGHVRIGTVVANLTHVDPGTAPVATAASTHPAE